MIKAIWFSPYDMDHIIWPISYGPRYGRYLIDHVIYESYSMIPFESYGSIPFCGHYFLVGRNLQNLHARFYFNDKSGNIEIALKVKMKIKLISMVKMTSSSVRSSTIKHFLQRLGTKTPWQDVRVFAEQNLGLISKKNRKLAALQFALTRDFKYLITSDDDFFIENWPCLGNWWHLVSFRYLKYRILNLL